MSEIEIVVNAQALAEAQTVRTEVFVVEQRVPASMEIDDADYAPTTTHVLAREFPCGPAIGTARLLADPLCPGEVHVGRVAVVASARGTGVGAELMGALEAIALARHAVPGEDGVPAVRVELSAQVQAIGFYEHLGYEVYGPVYLDAGIEHRDAAKRLTAPR